MAGLTPGGGDLHTWDAFWDPVALPIDGASSLAPVRAVVRALGRAAALSPAFTARLVVEAVELAGRLSEGPARRGRLLLRLLRDEASIGMEMILERHGGARLAVRKWESSKLAGAPPSLGQRHSP
jgi:hypothetical protein